MSTETKAKKISTTMKKFLTKEFNELSLMAKLFELSQRPRQTKKSQAFIKGMRKHMNSSGKLFLKTEILAQRYEHMIEHLHNHNPQWVERVHSIFKQLEEDGMKEEALFDYYHHNKINEDAQEILTLITKIKEMIREIYADVDEIDKQIYEDFGTQANKMMAHIRDLSPTNIQRIIAFLGGTLIGRKLTTEEATWIISNGFEVKFSGPRPNNAQKNYALIFTKMLDKPPFTLTTDCFIFEGSHDAVVDNKNQIVLYAGKTNNGQYVSGSPHWASVTPPYLKELGEEINKHFIRSVL
jgi:hypothetical protein